MKAFHKYSAALLIGVAGALSSCTPGQYWNEPGESAAVYAFPKGAVTISIDAEESVPEYYDVMVTRTNADAEVTVPVTFTANSDVLTGPSTVTFAAGSTTAYYRISISPAADVLVSYKATVTVEEPENPLIHLTEQNTAFEFTFQRTLVMEWADAGTAQVISSWVGNQDPIEVPVQVCSNWPRATEHVIRLVDMYYVMEPEYAEPGYSITLTLDADWNAVSLYTSWQYIGEDAGEDGYFFLGTPASYDCSFTNQGDVYTIDGLMATAPAKTGGSLSPYAYETVEFQWAPPAE